MLTHLFADAALARRGREESGGLILNRNLFLAMAGLVALAGCAGQNTGKPQSAAGVVSGPLGADRLRALYGTKHREDGTVISGEHAGTHWIKWIDPSGTMRLSAAHGLFHDDGRFRLEGDQVCTTWKHIDMGQTNCMRLEEAGPDTYVALDDKGAQITRFHVTTPGAPPEPLE